MGVWIAVTILVVLIIIVLIVSEIFFRNILKAPFVHVEKDTGAREFEQELTSTSIINKDGLKLNGMYKFHEEETHRYVICVHGYKDSHMYMLPYGKAFYERGYHVLLPDDRGHGKSEGRFIGMGWLDKEDVKAWVNWIVEKDPLAHIVIHGISMGAATTMMVAGDNPDPEHIDGYIEDCGYTCVWDLFKLVMHRDYHMPAFPILHLCDLFTKIRAGYGYKEASTLPQLKKAKKPMLFIHGEADPFIPVSMCYQNYETFEGTKDILIIPLAEHAVSMNQDANTYFNKVFSFIEREIGWND